VSDWHENHDDATRAGIAAGFFVLGASIVIGTLTEAGALARLVRALSAPVAAVLVGVVTGGTARRGGHR